MSPPESYLIIDIGTAWTKAFLVSAGDDLNIRSSAKLPTSMEDLRFSANLLVEKLSKRSKPTKIIVTASFSEAGSLTKVFGATFVSKEQVLKELYSWFSYQNFANPLILEGGASNYLKGFKVADIGAFLSFRISETDLENFIGNKTFRLAQIPENKKELEIDESILRSSFSTIPDFHNPTKLSTFIISGGIFSWSSSTTRAALLLLDMMSAGKVAQIYQDPNVFLNSYGALINQKKGFKAAGNKIFKNLGSLVSLGGEGKVSLDYGLSDVQEITVAENEIALIPASPSQDIKITLLNEQKAEFHVSGGEWGVILDGRVKPLPLQFGQEKTRQAVYSWQQALDKIEVISI